MLTAIKEPTEVITTTEATTTVEATTTQVARTAVFPERSKRFADATTTETITSGIFQITRCRDFVAANGNNERTQSGMAINQNSTVYIA